jgi:hypothetical protein
MKTREELLDQLGQLEGYFDELEIFQVLAKDYSADAVDRILSAPTQEQLDCLYCHGVTLEEYHKALEETRTDDSSYIAQVKYCEVCGRKLGDE